MNRKKSDRVACYIRVSTQEQKLHGISLDAQRDKLKEYAEKNGLNIVGWYEDEGVSGRKMIKNRPALQRMLKDAQAGYFDRIIFIKLDRFFRSVAEYHECMKLIDPVLWTATEEKYDLTTANGRAFVNMKLTIAELEADQTGERIRIVNQYKIKTGQALTGSQSQGIGFIVKKDDNGIKRVVKNPETEKMTMDILNYFMLHHNKSKTCRYISDTYNINLQIHNLDKLLKDTKLYGFYKGNPEYCEAYIDKTTYDKIQTISRNIVKTPPSNRVYLFSGLISCPVCGKILSHSINQNGIINLRCNNYSIYKNCTFKKRPNEKKVLNYVLDNLNDYVNDYVINVESIQDKDQDERIDHNRKITSLTTEIDKVKRMYRRGDLSDTEYDSIMDDLKSKLSLLQITSVPDKKRDLAMYKNLLTSDWKTIFYALNKENKRAFIRKYIKEIKINLDGSVKDVIFF